MTTGTSHLGLPRPGLQQMDLTGFKVEAIDGSIGKIDERPTRPAATPSSSTRARGSSARRSCCRQA